MYDWKKKIVGETKSVTKVKIAVKIPLVVICTAKQCCFQSGFKHSWSRGLSQTFKETDPVVCSIRTERLPPPNNSLL